MGSNNTDGNEAEYRELLCGALPVRLFLVVFRRVCTMVFVVDKIEPGVSVSEKSSRTGWMGTHMGKTSVDTSTE